MHKGAEQHMNHPYTLMYPHLERGTKDNYGRMYNQMNIPRFFTILANEGTRIT